MKTLLRCERLTKSYGRGATVETALAGVTTAWPPGEACVVLGPSGSGKTTLLSILGCLLSPSSGTVEIDNCRVADEGSAALASIRRRRIGFVFQHAQLLPFLSAEENLTAIARNCGLSSRQARARIEELITVLDIGPYRHRKPGELSGGQRQRVAVARALIHQPPIILADEPTASLDWENGQNAIRLLIHHGKANGAALIVVTHDTRLVPLFDRVLTMESGRIQKDERSPNVKGFSDRVPNAHRATIS